jgi:acetyl esterase/lipase
MDSRDYAFKAFGDGDHIYATAHWAKSQTDNPLGIALAFHGGGFVVGSRMMLPMVQIEYLANAGFVVVSADYRLCPQVSLYEGPIQDAKDVYAWCKDSLPALLKKDASLNVDPSRTVVFGHSAGGCLALHTVNYDNLANLSIICVLRVLSRIPHVRFSISTVLSARQILSGLRLYRHLR